MAARPSRIEEVRHGLLADLVNGTTPVGTKLPNEQEIASRFGVSRATVREAVGGLVESGYLLRRHGSGTFVTLLPSRRHALDATLSYTQMIRQAGMTPGLRLLSATVRPAAEDEAADLALEPGTALRVLERLRTADDRPVVYSIDLVDAGGSMDCATRTSTPGSTTSWTRSGRGSARRPRCCCRSSPTPAWPACSTSAGGPPCSGSTRSTAPATAARSCGRPSGTCRESSSSGSTAAPERLRTA